MITCKSCGAEVSPEKAWCPQCNQPVEAEAKRAVAREMDTFDGTLYEKKKPLRPAAPVVVPVAAAQPSATAAVATPAATATSDAAVAEPSGPPGRAWLGILGGILIGLLLLLLLAFAGAVVWYFLA